MRCASGSLRAASMRSGEGRGPCCEGRATVTDVTRLDARARADPHQALGMPPTACVGTGSALSCCHTSLYRWSHPDCARVKEYQAVVIRLSRHLRDDEDALTDLLNERSRGGWEPAMMAQDAQRLTVVFSRAAVPEG